jgi:uroporphyrinogen decarboxylase
MKLGELKAKFKGLVLWGNIDCAKTLVFGSKEEVAQETKRAIRQGGPGGGYILGSSNTIHPNVRLENFLVMLETARRYGKYPIEQ